MKRKVLIICTNADESGAPRHVEHLVQGLYECFDFMFLFGAAGPVSCRLKKLGFPVYFDRHLVSGINVFGDLALILNTVRLVDRLKPDLLHLHSAKAGLLGRVVGTLTTTKVVYTIHGWPWRGFPTAKRLTVWLVEYFLSFLPVNKYILVSEALIHEASGLGVRPNDSVVIHNCVPDIPTRLIARHRCERPPRIIMPARVTHAKDHETLLLALRDVCFQFELILCGAGTDTQSFERFLEKTIPAKRSQVICLGERNDVAKLMGSCDLFVLCSRFEAFPVSVVEALRAGLPVLATDVGGVKEAVDREVGALIGPGDVEGWNIALDEHRELGVRAKKGRVARARFEERFEIRRMVDEVSSVYLESI